MTKKLLLALITLTFTALLTMVSSTVAQAAEQATVAGSNLQLNGLAVQSELRKEWFLVGLYLPSKSSDAGDIVASTGAKRMELKVLADSLSGIRLKRFWIERIKNNNEAADVLQNARGVRGFADLMAQNFQANDVITIDNVPGKGMVVSINGSEAGVIPSAVFPLVLNTWIGPRPPTEEFKSSVLGDKSAVAYSDLLAKFSSIQPSASRVAQFDTAAQKAAEEEEARKKAEEEEKKRLEEEERKKQEAEQLAEQQKQQAQDALVAEQQRLADERADELRRQQDQAAQTDPQDTQTQVVTQPAVEEVPAGPTEAELASMRDAYAKSLNRHYVKFFKYPTADILRRHGKSAFLNPRKGRTHGEVSIAIEVDESGDLVGGRLVKSSGEKILDDAVMSALFDAVPYPSMPEDLPEETFSSVLPISIPAPQM